jgi:hypothetical protein
MLAAVGVRSRRLFLCAPRAVWRNIGTKCVSTSRDFATLDNVEDIGPWDLPRVVINVDKDICLHDYFSIEQDMHYAEFAEDEVSSFVRLTHPWIEEEEITDQ